MDVIIQDRQAMIKQLQLSAQCFWHLNYSICQTNVHHSINKSV